MTSCFEGAIVLQARFVVLDGESSLAAVIDGGKICTLSYSAEEKKFVQTFSFQMSEAEIKKYGMITSLCTNGRDRLFLATILGYCMVVDVTRSAVSGNLSISQTLVAHRNTAVMDICCDHEYLLMVDETGEIDAWKISSSGAGGSGDMYSNTLRYVENRQHGMFPAAATCAVCAQALIVVGYASGHIRIFSTKGMVLLAEVAAHTRMITALTLLPGAGRIAAAAEDGHVSVWSLPDSADPKVRLVQCSFVDQCLLMGIQYFSVKDDGNKDSFRLAVVAYDTRYLYLLK